MPAAAKPMATVTPCSPIVLKDVARAENEAAASGACELWCCLMQAYADWLGGSHRAAGDCEALLERLKEMANGKGNDLHTHPLGGRRSTVPQPSGRAPALDFLTTGG
ncbi:hypothetical protein QFZ68_007255 [Streptomyces sp. V1I6]|nr:hypothetical protein [Streptomyces sp. V1I6]